VLRSAITRRLIVVPLANNNHGKTQIIRAVVRQGERRDIQILQRAPRMLTSPWGRIVDALVIPRSYQETLKGEFGSVEAALNQLHSLWRQRDLIILPSHLVPADCATIIELAHSAGFDAIAVSVLLNSEEIISYAPCLSLSWDERWSLSNDHADDSAGQVDALGRDLWVWVTTALENR
jgi:hypothetical protein